MGRSEKGLKRELCGRCAAILREKKDVQYISGGVDHKVSCTECGRRRYGGVYDVKRKKTK